jgi:hypothetical protein
MTFGIRAWLFRRSSDDALCVRHVPGSLHTHQTMEPVSGYSWGKPDAPDAAFIVKVRRALAPVGEGVRGSALAEADGNRTRR